MPTFANAGPDLGGETGWPALFWLTGLLEAEGTFLKPPPSEPRQPIIACRMTDLDVVELVAGVLGTNVYAVEKGRYRTEYGARIKGARAVELMKVLRPMLSKRRRAAIDSATAGYQPPVRKLDFDDAEAIRRDYAEGESVSSLARRFGVTRPTIRAARDFEIYPVRERFPWRPISWVIRGADTSGTGLNWKELYWLAGWLEGEGSFVAPPPSSPRGPRIHVNCCDRDVVFEVARLLRVKPREMQDPRGLERGWSASWRALLTGGRAITLMQAIRPVMGIRRQQQIDQATEKAKAAGARAGWHENRSHRPTPDRVLLARVSSGGAAN